MAKTKYKHQQVMKLCIMTEEDVFNDIDYKAIEDDGIDYGSKF